MAWRVKNGFAEIGAAWIKESDGNKYLSVSIENPGELPVNAEGKASLTLMRNRFKERDNQPDYRVSCRVDLPDTQTQDAPKTPAPRQPAGTKPQYKSEALTEEDIPF